MRLAMFDIDGTLVKGNGIDDVCFCEAIEEILGVRDIDTDWSRYLKVTDSGTVSQIIEERLCREPEKADIDAVREAYVAKLCLKVASDPLSFWAVPGAAELMIELSTMDNLRVCIATGGWRDAALLKLSLAGITTEGITVTSSDDSDDRVSIMSQAYGRAIARDNSPGFVTATYVADNVWDFKNSEKLGFRFVGIGVGDHAQALRAAGALHVIPDFTDRVLFLRMIDVDS